MNERHALAATRFQHSIEVPRRFFEAEAERISHACLAVARRFHRGGRLLAFGAGNAATDAQHVSVEFVHPVIVGKRALPAIALGTDIAATLGLAARAGWPELYARQIATLGHAADIALGIDPTGDDPAVQAGLRTAAERGLLTIGLLGDRLKPPLRESPLDFCCVVPSDDPAVIQETHETLYHIFWELVHVFFEHKGLLDIAEAGVEAEASAGTLLKGSTSICTPGPDGRCAICADEGVPGRVIELRSGNIALVQMPAGPQEVAVDLIEGVQVGEELLVHMGVAIARLSQRQSSGASGSDPFSDFLYPFLEEPVDRSSASLAAVLDEVRGSTLQKAHEVSAMRRAFFDEQGDALTAAAEDMARSFANGGKLLAFGNGGSATDAQDIAADFLNPGDGDHPLPAISLTNDIGVVTAVGNDVGFDNVFARQIIAFGQPGDIALGFSTSGESPNLIAAFEQAKKMKLLTVGIAGYDGGKMARAGLDHCFVVHSTYIPRIQEVQATIYHTLWALTHHILRSNDFKSLRHVQEDRP